MKKRPGPKPLPRPPVARVVRLYAQGHLTLKGISLALGVSIAEAKGILDVYDVEVRPPHRKRRKTMEDGDE